METAIKKEINHYVLRNILANVGLSTYVIIDTLFIAIAAGSMGLTVLNLALPLTWGWWGNLFLIKQD